MLVFLFTLIVVGAGVGVFAHYNPGMMDITVHSYHLSGVPVWMPVAIAAAAPLLMFFIYATYASIRIRMLRTANARRTSSLSTRTASSTTR